MYLSNNCYVIIITIITHYTMTSYDSFPYPHCFDKPEQVFVPRAGLRNNNVSVCIFKPYIPRSIAEFIGNCHFKPYDPMPNNICDLYNPSRLYTHLFDTRNQEKIPLTFIRNPNSLEINTYVEWLLADAKESMRIDSSINSYYSAVNIMQNNIIRLNKALEHYIVPDSKIPTSYGSKLAYSTSSRMANDHLIAAAASLRYSFKLNGYDYQVLSDTHFYSMYLDPCRSGDMHCRIYISNINGAWYYDKTRERLINNIPAESIDDFPDGTVFVTSLDPRAFLTVLDAKDYAMHRNSMRQLRSIWHACKPILKDKGILDNIIGRYIEYHHHYYKTIYLKKVNGTLEFAYYY